MKQTNQTARARVLAPLLVLVVSICSSGCKRDHRAKAEISAVPVAVATVIVRQIREANEFNGRVWATDSVEVRPRVSGYVNDIEFREGQTVQRGSPLFLIDPRPYQDAVDSAKANLAREQAAEDLAMLQSKRAEVLKKSDAISQEEAQTRHSDLSQSIARVEAAKAALASAELNLSFTTVRAPITGRTSRVQLTVGNLAQNDQTVLTTVVSQDPVYVYFDCDEQSYLQYQQQTHGNRGISSQNPVRVGLANEDGFPHTGRIDFVDNSLNASTGTIRARVVVNNPQNTLLPGLFARVRLESPRMRRALLIDDRAVLTDQDRKYVYVVSPQNTSVRKDVTLGPLADGLRVITSGLTPEDRVVVDGFQQISSAGIPVVQKQVAMPAPDQRADR